MTAVRSEIYNIRREVEVGESVKLGLPVDWLRVRSVFPINFTSAPPTGETQGFDGAGGNVNVMPTDYPRPPVRDPASGMTFSLAVGTFITFPETTHHIEIGPCVYAFRFELFVGRGPSDPAPVSRVVPVPGSMQIGVWDSAYLDKGQTHLFHPVSLCHETHVVADIGNSGPVYISPNDQAATSTSGLFPRSTRGIPLRPGQSYRFAGGPGVSFYSPSDGNQVALHRIREYMT